MEKRKLTKEDLDKVRDIEGFPIGTDADIIALRFLMMLKRTNTI